ncbi:unnamed protein product, partial [Choristocarpus tenellus]
MMKATEKVVSKARAIRQVIKSGGHSLYCKSPIHAPAFALILEPFCHCCLQCPFASPLPPGVVLWRPLNQLEVGSGCLDLCWVGCGRADALYAGVAGEGWKPWDYAAGWLIAEEAGATVLQVYHVEY